MADKSSIEWTDATWNPTVGCSRVSEGCRHCYAEVMAWRHVLMCRALGRPCKYEGTVEMGPDGPRWTGVVRLDPDSLDTPLGWREPRRIFVDSMSDLFHRGLLDRDIARVFVRMALTPWHTHQILTKRPDRAGDLMTRHWSANIQISVLNCLVSEEMVNLKEIDSTRVKAMNRFSEWQAKHDPETAGEGFCARWPLPNVWIGTSVEDQKTANERVPQLLAVPAAVRFLSVEPLLGPVDLSSWLPDTTCECGHAETSHYGPAPFDNYQRTVGCQAGDGSSVNPICGCRKLRGEKTHDLGDPYRNHGLHWVIVGGESGHEARTCNVEWIESIVAQCGAAGVPLLVKQLGAKPVISKAALMAKTAPWPNGQWSKTDNVELMQPHLRDRKGGDMAEWPEHLRIREFPCEVSA